jgi:hypothetical protein
LGVRFRVFVVVVQMTVCRRVKLVHIFDGLGRAALAAAQFVVAGVGDDAHQPTLEGSSSALIQRLVRVQKGVLYRISRRVTVAQDAIGDVVCQLFIAHHQLVKGVKVAPLGGCHELSLVHTRSIILKLQVHCTVSYGIVPSFCYGDMTAM